MSSAPSLPLPHRQSPPRFPAEMWWLCLSTRMERAEAAGTWQCGFLSPNLQLWYRSALAAPKALVTPPAQLMPKEDSAEATGKAQVGLSPWDTCQTLETMSCPPGRMVQPRPSQTHTQELLGVPQEPRAGTGTDADPLCSSSLQETTSLTC